jgi:hypothetical protein
VAEDVAVGVPEIFPVEVSNDKPAGRAGLIATLLGTSVIVGVKVDIAVPPVNVYGDPV